MPQRARLRARARSRIGTHTPSGARSAAPRGGRPPPLALAAASEGNRLPQWSSEPALADAQVKLTPLTLTPPGKRRDRREPPKSAAQATTWRAASDGQSPASVLTRVWP